MGKICVGKWHVQIMWLSQQFQACHSLAVYASTNLLQLHWVVMSMDIHCNVCDLGLFHCFWWCWKCLPAISTTFDWLFLGNWSASGVSTSLVSGWSNTKMLSLSTLPSKDILKPAFYGNASSLFVPWTFCIAWWLFMHELTHLNDFACFIACWRWIDWVKEKWTKLLWVVE